MNLDVIPKDHQHVITLSWHEGIAGDWAVEGTLDGEVFRNASVPAMLEDMLARLFGVGYRIEPLEPTEVATHD